MLAKVYLTANPISNATFYKKWRGLLNTLYAVKHRDVYMHVQHMYSHTPIDTLYGAWLKVPTNIC